MIEVYDIDPSFIWKQVFSLMSGFKEMKEKACGDGEQDVDGHGRTSSFSHLLSSFSDE